MLKVFTNDIKKPEYILTLNKVLSSFLEFNEEIVKIENTSGGIANKVIKLTTNFDNKYIFKIYKKKRNQILPLELMKFLKKKRYKYCKS